MHNGNMCRGLHHTKATATEVGCKVSRHQQRLNLVARDMQAGRMSRSKRLKEWQNLHKIPNAGLNSSKAHNYDAKTSAPQSAPLRVSIP